MLPFTTIPNLNIYRDVRTDITPHPVPPGTSLRAPVRRNQITSLNFQGSPILVRAAIATEKYYVRNINLYS